MAENDFSSTLSLFQVDESEEERAQTNSPVETQNTLSLFQVDPNVSIERLLETERGAVRTDGLDNLTVAGASFLDSPLARVFTRPATAGLEVAERAIADVTGREREDRPMFPLALDREQMTDDQIALAEGFELAGDAAVGTAAFIMSAPALLARATPALRGALGKLTGRQLAELSDYSRGAALQRANVGGTSLVSSTPTGNRSVVQASADLVRAGVRRGGAFADDFALDILTTASRNPVGFALGEVSPTIGGIQGALIGGELAGSRETVEESAERGAFAGSVLNPVTLVIRGVQGSFRGVANNTRDFRAAAAATRAETGKKSALLSPVKLINNLADIAAKPQAALKLKQIADELGTTPNELARALDSMFASADRLEGLGVEGIGVAARRAPVGTLTNNDALVALQRRASFKRPSTRAEISRNDDALLKTLLDTEAALREVGSPEALRTAVAFRKQAFDHILSQRLDSARTRASSRLAETSRLDGAGRGAAQDVRRSSSRAVVEELQSALADMRKTERSLYSQFAGDQFIGPARPLSDTLELPASVAAEAGNEALLAPIKRVVSDLKDELGDDLFSSLRFARNLEQRAENGGTVDQLMNLRSFMMDEATKLQSGGQNNQAQSLIRGARAIKETIDSLDIEGLDVAREFSTQLNDVFTRSIVSRFIGKDRQGQFRINPELMLSKVLGTTSDNAVIQFDQIMEFAGFSDVAANAIPDLTASTAGAREALAESLNVRRQFNESGAASRGEILEALMGFDGSVGQSIMDETETFLRATVADFTDRQGNVDARALVRFMQRNEAMLSSRPEFARLRGELSSVESAAAYVRSVEESNKNLSNPRATRQLFGGLVGMDNPEPAVRRILNSPNREGGIKKLINIARKAENGTGGLEPIPGAMLGLRNVVLDSVFQNSRASTGGFSWSKYRDQLINSEIEGGQSLLRQLVDGDVLDRESADRLLRITRIGVRAERAMNNPADLDELFPEGKTSALAEALVGMAGSIAASGTVGRLTQGSGTGSIIIPSLGAKVARKFFIRNKADQIHDIILEAAGNAEMFRALLEPVTTTNVVQYESAWRQLDAMMVGAGLQTLGDFDDVVLTLPDLPDAPALQDADPEDIIEEEEVLTEGPTPSAPQADPFADGFFDQFAGPEQAPPASFFDQL